MNWEVILLVGIVLIGLVVGVWLRGVLNRYANGHVTVSEHEAGIKYRNGKLAGVLGPGRYATWPAPLTITPIDMREQSITVPGQEMLTADKMAVRTSLVLNYSIADARLHVSASSSPVISIYQAAQVQLRERVAARSLDDLLADRGALVEGMAEALAAEVAPIGYKVKAARLLDLTLAGPAKQAFADLWKAQKEGLVALERARGEQAALRSLANAARMLKGNPELMNLRLLQALSAAPGKAPPTIVLGGAGGLLPVSSAAESSSDAD